MCPPFGQVIHQTDLLQFKSRFFVLRQRFLLPISANLIRRHADPRSSASPFLSLLLAKENSKMHRSASWNRFSDEYYSHSSSPASKPGQALRLSSSFDGNELPTYDPVAEMARRERARLKLAETAVHVIPFVLLLCTIVLWFFSNTEIDVGMRGERMAANVEGLTIEGEIETEIDGTQTGVLPLLDTTASDSSKQPQDLAVSHKPQTKRLM